MLVDNKEVDKDGNVFYYDSEGIYHRDDGPAVIYVDGASYWFFHGESHCTTGPAASDILGNRWYIHGIQQK